MERRDWIPCTKAIEIGDGISYRLQKHWGMNVWAGEGLYELNGDASGCLHRNPFDQYLTCSRPLVVLQRIYEKGDKSVSAVLSYPNGLSHLGDKTYFWEIYPAKDGDVEMFFDEDEMETAVREVLNEP